MTDTGPNHPGCPSLPDSISDHVASSEQEDPPSLSSVAQVSLEPHASSEGFVSVPVVGLQGTDSSLSFSSSSHRPDVPESSVTMDLSESPLTPVISLSKDFHISGSSTSAFRPFITQTTMSSAREITSSTELPDPVTSTPVTRQAERPTDLGICGHPTDLTRKLSCPVDSDATVTPGGTALHIGGPVFLNPPSSREKDDGRSTASAPPCTPAPEPHSQPASPFRNNRQIKKIDLLAMSRSRQSDQAENARRDGRMAPSPRKKDEVLRNSGFGILHRGFSQHSNSYRVNVANPSPVQDRHLSPDRSGTGILSAASPNVDVVSVDETQADPSKCTFSIQFHDLAPAPHMLKCNLCGFVTNNQRFYRRHRRLHNRQVGPNAIHCSLCDYSTTQVRKMREHSITNHHMSHQHSLDNLQREFTQPSSVAATAQRPPTQGPILMGSGSMYQPLGAQPINVASHTAGLTDSSSLGLPTYIPTPQEHHIQVNHQAEHPPRGSAMMGNYATASDQQMASYMRSVLTNLISPVQGNRSNSMTSTGAHLQTARSFPHESQHIMPSSTAPTTGEDSLNYCRYWTSSSGLNNNHINQSGTGFVKVKAEPTPVHVARSIPDLPSSSSQDRCPRSPPRPSDTLDSESGMDMSSDDHQGSPQPDTDTSHADIAANVSNNHIHNNTTAAPSQFAVAPGVQSSLPFIKIEFPPHIDSRNMLSRPHYAHTDQQTQCDIISMSRSRIRNGRTQSETVSSAGGPAGSENRCDFCGVTFDDEVLYSIHIGCHSHSDPFVCNVCGKQCHNKYGFYSHIMRGHQART